VEEPRNTNAPLFITVLCACLGLLTAGVPAEASARQAPAEAAYHYVASSAQLRLAASAVTTIKVRKVDDRWLADFDRQTKGQLDPNLYQNSKALTDTHQVLLVTHLPRAALSEHPAKSQTASRAES
jgi:hypothetical protein